MRALNLPRISVGAVLLLLLDSGCALKHHAPAKARDGLSLTLRVRQKVLQSLDENPGLELVYRNDGPSAVVLPVRYVVPEDNVVTRAFHRDEDDPFVGHDCEDLLDTMPPFFTSTVDHVVLAPGRSYTATAGLGNLRAYTRSDVHERGIWRIRACFTAEYPGGGQPDFRDGVKVWKTPVRSNTVQVRVGPAE
jgi:hypothetical protein